MRDFFRFTADYFNTAERALGGLSLAVAISTAFLWALHLYDSNTHRPDIVFDIFFTVVLTVCAARLLFCNAGPTGFPGTLSLVMLVEPWAIFYLLAMMWGR
jgi:hypothetical protein